MPRPSSPAQKSARKKSSSRSDPATLALPKQQVSARKWLKTQLGIDDVSAIKGGRQLGEVVDSLKLRVRSSDEDLYASIATVYALWLELEHNLEHPLLQSLAKQVGRPVEPNQTLRIITEALIPYGSGQKDIRRAQKLHMRDIGAIRHLKKKGVLPGDVVKLAAQKGQGVAAWYQKARASQTAKVETTTQPNLREETINYSKTREVIVYKKGKVTMIMTIKVEGADERHDFEKGLSMIKVFRSSYDYVDWKY